MILAIFLGLQIAKNFIKNLKLLNDEIHYGLEIIIDKVIFYFRFLKYKIENKNWGCVKFTEQTLCVLY